MNEIEQLINEEELNESFGDLEECPDFQFCKKMTKEPELLEELFKSTVQGYQLVAARNSAYTQMRLKVDTL